MKFGVQIVEEEDFWKILEGSLVRNIIEMHSMNFPKYV